MEAGAERGGVGLADIYFPWYIAGNLSPSK